MKKLFDCNKNMWGDCECTNECRRGRPVLYVGFICPCCSGTGKIDSEYINGESESCVTCFGSGKL